MKPPYLYVPWRCLAPRMRLSAALALVSTLIGAGLMLGLMPHEGDTGAAVILALGLTFSGTLTLAAAAAMARDAWRLRLPGAVRAIERGVLLAAVAPPTLVAAFWTLLGMPAWPAAGLVAAGLIVGASWATAPRVVSVALGPALMALLTLHQLGGLPALSSMRLAVTLGVLAASLTAWSIASWRGFVRGQPVLAWLGPPALLAGAVDVHTLSPSAVPGTAPLRQSSWLSARLRAQPYLAHTGPAWPTANLRLLLGPTYMPTRLGERIRQGVPEWVLLAAFGLWFVSASHTWLDIGILVSFVLLWFAGLISLCTALIAVNHIDQCWMPHGAERPMMALTPKLSPPSGLPRHLLVATLGTPCRVIALCAAAQLAAAALSGNDTVMVAALIVQGAALLTLLAGVMCVLSQRKPSAWIGATWITLDFVLASLSSFLPMGLAGFAATTRVFIATALAIGWMLFIGTCLYLIQRGWHHFNALPNPWTVRNPAERDAGSCPCCR